MIVTSNEIILSAEATGAGSVLWELVSAHAVPPTIEQPAASSTRVFDFAESGRYVFRCTVDGTQQETANVYVLKAFSVLNPRSSRIAIRLGDAPPEPPLPVNYLAVSPAGDDTTGNGTNASPFKTIYHAASQAASGDVIFLKPGNYHETQQIYLPPGVGIEGSGIGVSNIYPSYDPSKTHWREGFFMVNQVSGVPVTISKFSMNGNETALRAICCNGRSNHTFRELEIKNFVNGGLGLYDFYNAQYATDNSVIDCVFLNNSLYRDVQQGGSLDLHYQDGLLIDGCTIDHRRIDNNTGNNINAIKGYLKNMEIRNCQFFRNDDDGQTWQFHMEIWKTFGGIHIHNNSFLGGGQCIDFGGMPQTMGAGTSYGAWVHHNHFEKPTRGATYRQSIGITLEQGADNMIVEYNTFKNIQSPMTMGAGAVDGYSDTGHVFNIKFRYNVIDGAGCEGVNDLPVVVVNVRKFVRDTVDVMIQNIEIHNNTIVNSTPRSIFKIENCLATGLFEFVHIYNNIVANCTAIKGILYATNRTDSPVAPITDTYFENNLFFGNYIGSNPVTAGGEITYDNGRNTSNTTIVNQNGIFADPMLDASFELLPGSPAVGAGKYGLDIGAKPSNT